MSVIEKFLPIVLEEEEESNNSPIIVWGEVTFVYIKYNNLYIVATTKINANATLIFSFLHKLVQVSYFVIYRLKHIFCELYAHTTPHHTIYTLKCSCMHNCMYSCTHSFMNACTHAHIHACKCTRKHTHTHASLFIYVIVVLLLFFHRFSQSILKNWKKKVLEIILFSFMNYLMNLWISVTHRQPKQKYYKSKILNTYYFILLIYCYFFN